MSNSQTFSKYLSRVSTLLEDNNDIDFKESEEYKKMAFIPVEGVEDSVFKIKSMIIETIVAEGYVNICFSYKSNKWEISKNRVTIANQT